MTNPIREEWTSFQGTHRLLWGDSLAILPMFEADTFDAIVTDPPAGIGFMGKEWDDFRRARNQADAGRDDVFGRTSSRAPEIGRRPREMFVAWMTAVAAEMLRVLKPGGHALVWALPRTSHWTATALEDAGFEVRDRISHLFGSGFPKSLDVSKAIDKAAGAERSEVIGTRSRNVKPFDDSNGWNANNTTGSHEYTAPATEAARQWNGWGTALKPACEDWWLVRKPLSEKTVAANVLRWGTGALNIDGCRIGLNGDYKCGANGRPSQTGLGDNYDPDNANKHSPVGRWPANVCLSHHPDCICRGTKRVDGNGHWPSSRPASTTESGPQGHAGQDELDERHASGEEVEAWDCHPDCPCAMFPDALGQQAAVRPNSGTGQKTTGILGKFATNSNHEPRGDSGSAARFFYCAKASRSDRGQDNKHPTVKNTELMRWLCRLITPPGGLILDCFLGSGSTAVAAWNENFRFVGIEQEEEYFRTSIARMEREAARTPLFDSPATATVTAQSLLF